MSIEPTQVSREAELGAFLRTHRERLTPSDVGLPPGRRRRTPGLRREEVAQLSGLSATWITWLEQGRPVAMSVRALGSLAEALRLSRAERAYLFALAGKPEPRQDAEPAVPAALLASVQAISGPAYLLDRQWTARAWNDAAADLFVGWLDAASGERNLLRAMFLPTALQALVEDWPHRAARLVAEFRVHSLRHAEDPPTRALIERLMEDSPAFAAAWRSQDVDERQGGRRGFHHPTRGLVYFEQLTLVPPAAPGMMLVMLLPETA
ncbi:helix-turn-helix transcriptional regulator [Cupriavidus metallidurans]|uniref:helix-turn-helix transcriptional regulator n=1 Tax=Cupriavidus TaxID=106589 RepID=UPI0002D71A14|nr:MULTISPECIES: helix-turn-helix transcriptional regulator [Cupriavidus]GMG88979.1 transcriptional regulator [Cupriavidus sp. TKC]HBO79969.1 XRE family transcriptional regulator [Cupriavidus sp.]